MCALAVAASCLSSAQARANTATKGDPDDVAGALDISLIHHEHSGTRLVHRVGMHDPFDSDLLRIEEGRYIAVGFDTDNDFADDRTLYVFYRRGKLRGVVRNADDERIGAVEVTRPNQRSVKAFIERDLLGNVPGYRWAAYSVFTNDQACSPLCLDLAPNTTRVLHDYTTPTVKMISFPNISTRSSATTRFDVEFKVRDRGFSELAVWRLQQRVFGLRAWTTASEGETEGRKTRAVRGEQGTTYEFRVVAIDGQGNRKESGIRRVSIPFDDRHDRFDGRYDGRWDREGRPRDFRGTLKATEGSEAQLRFRFRGSFLAWIAKNGEGRARVRIDGERAGTVDLTSVEGRRKVVFKKTLERGRHRVAIKRLSGRINVDGVVLR